MLRRPKTKNPVRYEFGRWQYNMSEMSKKNLSIYYIDGDFSRGSEIFIISTLRPI